MGIAQLLVVGLFADLQALLQDLALLLLGPGQLIAGTADRCQVGNLLAERIGCHFQAAAPLPTIKEPPRKLYANKTIWDAVYAQAVPELRDAMDLAYLTGQRPGDVIKATAGDLSNGYLLAGQGKTEKR